MKPGNRRFLLLPDADVESTPPVADPPLFSLSSTSSSSSSSSKSMAVTALIILLGLFFFGFFAVYARRAISHLRRRSSSSFPPSFRQTHGRILVLPPSHGLDHLAVRALPVLRYIGGGRGMAGGGCCCVVCLSEFEEKELVKVIPRCGHTFHPACIDAWLLTRGSCPLCRCSDVLGSSSGSHFLGLAAAVVAAEQEPEEAAAAAAVAEKAAGRRMKRSESCGGGEKDELASPSLRRTCSL